MPALRWNCRYAACSSSRALGGLARGIASSRSSVVLPPLLPQAADAAPVLSFAEERLWFIQQYAGQGSATYNMPLALQLDGALDVSALHASLDWLVARHASLRTCYPSVEGQAQVALLPAAAFTWPVHDLSHLAEAAQAAAVQQHADHDAQQPFDLSQGRCSAPVCCTFLRSSMCCWSTCTTSSLTAGRIPVLLDDWAHAYRAWPLGKPPAAQHCPSSTATTPPGNASGCKARCWNASGLTGYSNSRAHPHCWNCPPTTLARPSRTTTVRITATALDPGLTPALHQLARRHGVSLYMLLLAAFNVLLSRHSGQDDIVVGSPIANRTHQHSEALGRLVRQHPGAAHPPARRTDLQLSC